MSAPFIKITVELTKIEDASPNGDKVLATLHCEGSGALPDSKPERMTFCCEACALEVMGKSLEQFAMVIRASLLARMMRQREDDNDPSEAWKKADG